MRLQLSMLLLAMTTRANFCAMKFVSFVDFEQLKSPNAVPFSFANPAAARSIASSQLAGRKEPVSFTMGCVRRLYTFFMTRTVVIGVYHVG